MESEPVPSCDIETCVALPPKVFPEIVIWFSVQVVPVVALKAKVGAFKHPSQFVILIKTLVLALSQPETVCDTQ